MSSFEEIMQQNDSSFFDYTFDSLPLQPTLLESNLSVDSTIDPHDLSLSHNEITSIDTINTVSNAVEQIIFF